LHQTPKNADTLVSIGGVQSNHNRMVAAVAAKIGMKCHLVQESWVPHEDAVYDRVGNIMLSRIMGADVRLVDEGFDIGIRKSLERCEGRQALRDPGRCLDAVGFSKDGRAPRVIGIDASATPKQTKAQGLEIARKWRPLSSGRGLLGDGAAGMMAPRGVGVTSSSQPP
jgi:1-aminocyclopropane-1-carboxylate deaminase